MTQRTLLIVSCRVRHALIPVPRFWRNVWSSAVKREDVQLNLEKERQRSVYCVPYTTSLMLKMGRQAPSTCISSS